MFTTAEALRHINEDALAGDRYEKLLHGVYTVKGPVDHGLRIEAVRRRLGPEVILTGPSAAWAWGARLARARSPVHVIVGSGLARRPLVAPHRVPIRLADVAVSPLGPATSPVRTCVDLARGIGTGAASWKWRVAVVEAVMTATGTRADDVRAAADHARRLRGLPRARAVLTHVRDGSESVRETLLRLCIIEAGFPEPATQYVVVDEDGVFVARLDLAWEEHRAGAEYDGAVHLDPDRHTKDLARHNALRATSWTVLQVDRTGLARPRPFLTQLATLVPLRRTPPKPVITEGRDRVRWSSADQGSVVTGRVGSAAHWE
ncbi:MAG: hypothetical protein ACFCVF_07760 [Kineosporiaceae bacterium]